jgi:hypothetical protein
MTELIKGTYIGTDKGQPKEFTYIREFESYQALLNEAEMKLDPKSWEHKTFSIFLKEFEQLMSGRERDILPVTYDLGYLSGAGYIVSGQTSKNKPISVDLAEISDGDFLYYGIRFATYNSNANLKKILTDFSKDPNYYGRFTGTFFQIGTNIDSVLGSIGAHMNSSVSIDNYHSGGLKMKGDSSPIIQQAYNNLLTKLPAEK